MKLYDGPERARSATGVNISLAAKSTSNPAEEVEARNLVPAFAPSPGPFDGA
jgi:hypothetical protein